MHAILNLLENPHQAIKTIHVAGTNGKGSVSTKIASTLQKAGFKVGLYTSPHLFSIGERIQVDSIPMPLTIMEKEVGELLNLCEQHSISASFFDIITACAFLRFFKEKVDYAVIETGLGGRLDSTNVIHPLISVITSISLDHTEYLGDTIEKIAFEKAGIVKNGVPVVVGPKAPHSIFQNAARERQASCYFVKSSFEDYDEENQETARLALEVFREHGNAENIADKVWSNALAFGLSKRPPCRFETHAIAYKNTSIQTIFDVAHNPDGFLRFFEKYHKSYPNRPCHAIAGFSKGKKLNPCIEILCKEASSLQLIEADNPRAVLVSEISPLAKTLMASKSMNVQGREIGSALENAFYNAWQDQGVVVVIGTFFIMGDVCKSLKMADGWNVENFFDILSKNY